MLDLRINPRCCESCVLNPASVLLDLRIRNGLRVFRSCVIKLEDACARSADQPEVLRELCARSHFRVCGSAEWRSSATNVQHLLLVSSRVAADAANNKQPSLLN